MTDQQIGDATGISQEQISRFLKPSRVMLLEQTAAICKYLGLDLSAALNGERRLVMPSSDHDEPPRGGDVRSMITWLLAHPLRDEELNARLSDAATLSGMSGRRLVNLQETIRTVRREELEHALGALPPSTERADDQQSG